jgi:hypothetical protein
MPVGSTHASPFSATPLVISSGRGARSAIRVCASTGRLAVVWSPRA